MANKCVAYVPEQYQANKPHGLVVWLHAPGLFDQDELVKQWKPLCDQFDLILLAPQSVDPQRWTVPEIEFVQKTIDNVTSSYTIDPHRVVTHGYLAGAAMAYHVALAHRDVCRGIAPVGAPLPARMAMPDTDPLQPLAIYSCSSPESEAADLIQAGEKRLQEKAFPVTVVTIPGAERYLTGEEMAALTRWIDTLDRM
jgi:poly(3-hydroxybutyrate) depolymerase